MAWQLQLTPELTKYQQLLMSLDTRLTMKAGTATLQMSWNCLCMEWAIIDLILRPHGVLKHVRCVATYLLVAGQYPKRRNIFDSPWRYLCFRKNWHRAWFIL